jgi:hypothetical protein
MAPVLSAGDKAVLRVHPDRQSGVGEDPVSDGLAVNVDEVGADSERLEELSLALRAELLELNVDDVQRLRVGQAPAGTRALDVAAVGALLVSLSSSAGAVSRVVNLVRGWLKRGSPGRTVELPIGDKTLKLSEASTEQQERLIQQFLRSVDEG